MTLVVFKFGMLLFQDIYGHYPVSLPLRQPSSEDPGMFKMNPMISLLRFFSGIMTGIFNSVNSSIY